MNTNIALIGASGSGVTTFISEMYNDINTLAPLVSISEHSRAISVHSDVITPHTFDLIVNDTKKQNKKTWTFTINDYKGTLLKERENAGPAFYEYNNDLMNAKIWIILIDSHCFTNDTFEGNVKAIIKSCSRNIMPFLSDYIEKHNNTPPEIIFAVTKGENVKCNKEDMTKAIMEAFKAMNQSQYVPVVLLSNCMQFKSAGLAVLTLLCNEFIKNEKKNQNNNNNSDQPTKKDVCLEILSAAAKCLIENNKGITVNGFDKFSFEYNDNKDLGKYTAIALLIDLGLIVVFLLFIISKVGLGEVIGGIVVLVVFVALTIGVGNIIAQIFFAICSLYALVQIADYSGKSGIAIVVGFAVWVIASAIVGALIDEKMENLPMNPQTVKYKDQNTAFLYTKARERK